jgi:hypothetical protein
MDAMQAAASAAAYLVSSRDARLPDFSIGKPEVWFSIVEAMFEDCNVTNSKQGVVQTARGRRREPRHVGQQN